MRPTTLRGSTGPRSRYLAGLSLALLATLHLEAKADCPSPYEPLTQSVAGVTRLNVYAQGTHCIIGSTPYCQTCVSGYQHRCDAYGQWKVDKAYPCDKATSRSDGGDAGGAGPGRGDRGQSGVMPGRGAGTATPVEPLRYEECHYFGKDGRRVRLPRGDVEDGFRMGLLTSKKCFQRACRFYRDDGSEVDLSQVQRSGLLPELNRRRKAGEPLRQECTPPN